MKKLNKKVIPEFSTCTKCKVEKPASEFYFRKTRGTLHSHCKECLNKGTVERVRKVKEKAVEYKGGKCEKCGLIDHQSVYDFHHIDPSKKDFQIGLKKLESLTI